LCSIFIQGFHQRLHQGSHNFQRDLQQYEQKNAIILGVSVQDESTHQKFCAKEGLSFKLLADTKYAVSSSYDSLVT